MSRTLVAVTIVLPVLAILLYCGAPEQAAAASRPGKAGGGGRPAVPRAWVPKAKSERWECIVIHHSATDVGGAKRFDRAHRERGFDELGYHFVIGNGSDTADGHVEVGSRWRAQKYGAHCRSPQDYYNEHGIGVCLVGNFDEARPTAAQMASLKKLLRHLSHTYGIPAKRIHTHGGVTGQTHCPGKHFDLKAVRKAVR